MNKLVNWKHLYEYQHIFGLSKLAALWVDYLEQAQQSWSTLPPEACEQLRLTFHSWKSSSQVFGLDEFSRRCSQVEDNILNRRHLDGLPGQINDCRECFEQSIAELIPYFEKWKSQL